VEVRQVGNGQACEFCWQVRVMEGVVVKHGRDIFRASPRAREEVILRAVHRSRGVVRVCQPGIRPPAGVVGGSQQGRS
jgi:hypothetical protein